MSESHEARSGRSEIVPGTVLGSAFLQEMRIWMSAQGDVLSAAERQMIGWMTRRREDVEALSRSVQKISACQNPIDFFQIQQDWLSRAFERAASDLRALAEDAKSWSARMTAGFEMPGVPAPDAWQTRRARTERAGAQQDRTGRQQKEEAETR